MLYNQSIARRSLLGDETQNPSIAAKSLFRGATVRRAIARAKKRRRPFHRGNPSLASVASLVPGGSLVSGLLAGLGGRFRKRSEVRAAAVAPQVVQAANAGNLTAARGLIDRAAHPMLAKEHAVWVTALAQVAPSVIAAVQKNIASIPQASQRNPEEFAASVMASPVQLPGGAGAATPAAGIAGAASFLTPGLVTGVVRAATKTRRTRRQRYPSYVDRRGQQRYSSKPPGTELRIPAGATPTPGTPYNFFRGAVGRGGALATAGQAALAAGAGIGAYLVTQRLLEHLGGRAQKKEEAGVAAALAVRQARADFKQQEGRAPNRTELREMGQAYKRQLLELGYDPVTFTRTRSGVESFLETYNPFGGD